MVVAWDYEDAPRLVGHLSPPMPPQAAEQLLRRIYRAFARERYRERTQNQSTKQVRRELETLHKSLAGLSARAISVLETALGEGTVHGLGGILPRPIHESRLVVVPAPVQFIDAAGADITGWPLSGPMMLELVRRAVDRSTEDLQPLRRGHPGNWSNTERKVIRLLRNVYCHTHGTPWPRYDFLNAEVLHPEALEFAIHCMRAWIDKDARGMTPEILVRSLP